MAHDPETVDAFYDDLVPALTKKATDEIAVMARPRVAVAAETRSARRRRPAARGTGATTTPSCAGPSTASTCTRSPPTSRCSRCSTACSRSPARCSGSSTGRSPDAPVWHPDVRTFAIVDAASGEDIAVVHMDLHPREGKFSHAAAFTLVRGRRLPDGSYRRPVSAIVANLTKPTADRPSLLLHDEVVTLFHEFGHILHQTLTTAETARFSGTSTERDFVEAPSQIMEHWCWRPEVLDALRPPPRDRGADPGRARRPARRGARPQRRRRQPPAGAVRHPRHGPPRAAPPGGRHDGRRRT